MTGELRNSHRAGPLGPVAFSVGLLLMFAAPLMRGGNRHVALIVLEVLGLAVLVASGARLANGWRDWHDGLTRQPFLLPVLLSPLLLALVQLVPLPASWWNALGGHDVYAQTMDAAGAPGAAWRPLSVSPDATAASLLAAIPIVAAFLLGYFATLSQLRNLLRVVAVLAFAEVALALLQVSGGQFSPLFFGVMTYGPPVGTFANRNHFANYVAMALAAYVWLGYEAARGRKHAPGARARVGGFTERHMAALWVMGGLVLVLGILLSRSRGAAVFGLPMAGLAVVVVALRIAGWTRGSRYALALIVAMVFGAAALMGFNEVVSRISAEQLAGSASFRNELARTSLQGAIAFWPWGSGLGTYDVAYPRFQPGTLPVFANHAHQDYVELLFEAGIFFVVIAAILLWLAGRRAWLLVSLARRDRTLHRDAMAAALCGLGLLGLLLHSLVEFNMRIPANAILGALLAGAYLRPISLEPKSE